MDGKMGISRRNLLGLIAAPAIVRATSIMPVRGLIMAVETFPIVAGIYLYRASINEYSAIVTHPEDNYSLEVVKLKPRQWFHGDPVITTDIL